MAISSCVLCLPLDTILVPNFNYLDSFFREIFLILRFVSKLTPLMHYHILITKAYDLFGQRWDRRALVSAITGCREFHDIR